MERTPESSRLFVGTYTDGSASEGIYVLALDEGTRHLRVANAGTHAPNPSYLVRAGAAGWRTGPGDGCAGAAGWRTGLGDGRAGAAGWSAAAEAGRLARDGAGAGAETRIGGLAGSLLYAAHELDDRSCLAAYDVAEDGTLRCRGACSSPADAGTCFAAVHPAGRCLYGANYGSGSVGLCLLAADGSPHGGLPPVRHAGSGPNRARQEGPHVHSARFVPGTSLLAVVDLGCDTVTLYRAETTGALETPPIETVRVPPGSGPRMLAFHPRLPLAALVNELANDVLLYRFGRTGTGWEQVRRLGLPTARDAAADGCAGSATVERAGAAGHGRPVLAAHAAFSPDGRHLYVSVRGSDRLALFEVDANGGVSPQADFPSGGRGPRHFSLSPTGDRLAVANQDSNEVVLFALDAATGAPREEARIAISQPSCVIWDR